MRYKIILFLAAFLFSGSLYSQILEQSVKATQTLETGVSFVYQGSDIPVLDLTYNEFSADSITWRKNYVAGDCYLRLSNDVKSTWWGYNFCTGTGTGTSNIDTIFWTVDGVTDTITSGSASLYITNPDTVSGTSTNFQDTETHTHELYIELNDNEDVDASPANGQVIKWNSATSEWEASDDLIAGGASGYLTVGEQDGSPSITNVIEILVTNGTVTDNGAGSVSIDMLLQPVDGAQDFFRTDTVRVAEGDTFLTFSTPFPANDYILDAMYAIYDDGTRQDLVSDSTAADGFRVLSILEDSATVNYLAMRNLDSLGLAATDQGRVFASGSDPVLGFLNQKTDDSTIIVTNDELTVLGAPSITAPLDSLLFSTDIASLAWNEGMFYFDSVKQSHVGYIEELDVTFEFMYEEWIRVYNNSGVTIENGDVAYLSGVVADANNTVTVALAQADSAATCLSTLGVATHSIEDGTYGILTREGTVRDVNSTAMGFTSPGELGYLSATNAGKITPTSPGSPNYSIKLGNVGKVDASTGTFEVGIDIGGNTGSVIKIFNGATLENTTVDVSSNGTTITTTIEKGGGGDLSLFFDGIFHVFPSTPAASVNLVAGTDTIPVRNWVYIPKSTLTLTASQSGFPTNEQYVPVADVMCPSALGAFNNGMDKVHAWTDHLANSVGQGHMADINFWIRNQHATYLSGVALTTDPLEDIFAANMDVSLSSGSILQLHPHTFAALSTTTSDSIKVINDPTFTNRPIGSLNSTDLSADSEGGSLNNKYYSVVLWGVVSEDAEDCQMFLTLPSGSYTNASNAKLDALGYTNKSIPTEYIGTGFLINRLTLQNSGGNIKIVADGIENLRGTIPGISGAGSPGAGGITNYDGLSDTPASKTGFSLNYIRVNTGETAHEYMPNGTVINGSDTLVSGDAVYDYVETNFVPYTGAITNVDLGLFDLYADSLSITNGAAIGSDLDVTGTGTFGTNAVINGGGDSYFNGGNVGIGTASPSDVLHIKGSVSQRLLIESTGSQPQLNLKNSVDEWAIFLGSGTTDLHFYNDGDRLLISSSGDAVFSGTVIHDAPTLSTESALLSDITGGSRDIIGNTLSGGFTAGSVVFSNGSTLSQDNTDFSWDESNNILDINGQIVADAQINRVINGAKTSSFTHDAAVADRGAYTLNTSSAVVRSIHNLESGSMGTISLKIGASNPSSITINTYSDAGSTGLTEVVIGNAIANAANKKTTITYDCANDGTSTEVDLIYGQEQ